MSLKPPIAPTAAAGDAFDNIEAGIGVTFQDGTASAPGIRFGSDTNTGWFRKGTDKPAFSAGGLESGFVNTDGALVWYDFANDSAYTGSSGTSAGSIVSGHNRFFRSVNFARNGTVRLVGVNNSNEVVLGGETGTNPTLVLRNTASTTARGEIDKSFWLTDATTEGYVQFSEQSSTPDNPAANGARLYAIDDGSGNTELRARFNSGVYRIASQSTAGVTVASAATIAIPNLAQVVTVTGTTNITSVTATFAGHRATLIFQGVLNFTDGSNLKLASTMATTADDTITIACDGTNWFEVGRSVN